MINIQKRLSSTKKLDKLQTCDWFIIHWVLRSWGIIRTCFPGWVVNLFLLISAIPAGLLSPCPLRNWLFSLAHNWNWMIPSNTTIPTMEWNYLMPTPVEQLEVPYTSEHLTFICKLYYNKNKKGNGRIFNDMEKAFYSLYSVKMCVRICIKTLISSLFPFLKCSTMIHCSCNSGKIKVIL